MTRFPTFDWDWRYCCFIETWDTWEMLVCITLCSLLSTLNLTYVLSLRVPHSHPLLPNILQPFFHAFFTPFTLTTFSFFFINPPSSFTLPIILSQIIALIGSFSKDNNNIHQSYITNSTNALWFISFAPSYFLHHIHYNITDCPNNIIQTK